MELGDELDTLLLRLPLPTQRAVLFAEDRYRKMHDAYTEAVNAKDYAAALRLIRPSRHAEWLKLLYYKVPYGVYTKVLSEAFVQNPFVTGEVMEMIEVMQVGDIVINYPILTDEVCSCPAVRHRSEDPFPPWGDGALGAG